MAVVTEGASHRTVPAPAVTASSSPPATGKSLPAPSGAIGITGTIIAGSNAAKLSPAAAPAGRIPAGEATGGIVMVRIDIMDRLLVGSIPTLVQQGSCRIFRVGGAS
ncbi:hypothetical protein [uncultured Sphingomonas sp.]|uniref:hypothetical protein n=1 Tax=Sphingomonas sp. 179-A 2A2 NHS TaxID=3374290 RepID=UPI0025F772F7|nr:hypothetical protein [uncultured Sphingomonas sp.]